MAERTGQVNAEGRPGPDTYPGARAELSGGLDEGLDKTAVIRADIERTRAEMTGTIAALQERLSPQVVKETVVSEVKEHLHEATESLKGQVKEHYQEARSAVREATVGRVEHMVRDASDRFDDARASMVDTVRANPIPAAMVGLGLAWLLSSSRRAARERPYRGYGYRGERSFQGRDRFDQAGGRELRDRNERNDEEFPYGYERGVWGAGGEDRRHLQSREHEQGAMTRVQERVGDVAGRAGEAAEHLRERAGEAAEHLRERAGEAAHTVQHRVGDYTEQARRRADYYAHQASDRLHRAEYRLEERFSDNPMVMGAVTLAAGVALGLALPRTQKEDRLLGGARDQLVGRAEQLAHTTIDKAQQAAEQATQRVSKGTEPERAHWQERPGQA